MTFLRLWSPVIFSLILLFRFPFYVYYSCWLDSTYFFNFLSSRLHILKFFPNLSRNHLSPFFPFRRFTCFSHLLGFPLKACYVPILGTFSSTKVSLLSGSPPFPASPYGGLTYPQLPARYPATTQMTGKLFLLS